MFVRQFLRPAAFAPLARCPAASPASLALAFSRSFHSPALRNPAVLLSGPNPNGDFVPRPQVRERIFTLLRHIKKVDQSKLTEEASFADLGLDSLDTVEVIIQIEEEFALDIYDPVAAEILTVKQAIDTVENLPFAAQ